MQPLQRSSDVRDRPAALAASLESSWQELATLVLHRKLRSAGGSERGADLSPVELRAISLLSEADMRMGELARRIGLSESAATRLVDRLAAAALVERRPGHPDRRCVLAGLTPRGRRLAGAARDDRLAFLRDVLGALEPAEQEKLVDLFRKVAGVLREREAGR